MRLFNFSYCCCCGEDKLPKWAHHFYQLVVLVYLFSILEAKSEKPCQSMDPTGKSVPGQCLRFLLCPRLLDFAKRPGKTVDDFRLLKNLTCGFGKDEPWICCPVNDIYRPPGRDESTPPVPLLFPDEAEASMNETLLKRTTPPDVPVPTEDTKFSLVPRLRDCGEPRHDLTNTRIIGGTRSEPGQFPYMALLYRIDTVTDEEEFYCSGTIINQHYILTAAHCIVTNEGSGHRLAYVQVGITDVTERCHHTHQRECLRDRRYNIAETVVHPKYIYGATDRSHDIALLRTKKLMDFKDEFIRPVCLPFIKAYGLSEETVEGLDVDPEDPRGLAPEIGTGIVAGWGRDSNANPSSTPALKHTLIPILSRNECQQRYGNQVRITDKQFCAGGRGRDTCVGDSGGPLLIPFLPIMNSTKWEQRFAGKVFQTGIISFGPALCGNAGGKPSVYTKVVSYIDWILDSMYL